MDYGTKFHQLDRFDVKRLANWSRSKVLVRGCLYWILPPNKEILL